MTNGWLHTGDMAVWDEENYIHIVDRKKDIIICGGENISSIEVEKAIAAHPAVLECAVVSAPDPQWGEVPAAFVVLQARRKRWTSADLWISCSSASPNSRCRAASSSAKRPLPKTGTGKIVKRELARTVLERQRAARPRMKFRLCGNNTTHRSADSLGLSALVAALPIFTLLLLLGVLRKPAWMASLAGLAAAVLVAAGRVRHALRTSLPAPSPTAPRSASSPSAGSCSAAILLYRITLESGKFEVLKDSIGHLTDDRRLQALLIAFAFGAFIEGAAGFGTPVAVAAAMLTGLGFSPFYAAAICLLANTAPVAFGSIGIPIITLAVTTGLPLDRLSAGVGRICAPDLAVRAGLPDPGDGRVEGAARRAARRGRVRHRLRRHPIRGLQLRRPAAHRHPVVAGGHRRLVVLIKVWKPRDTFELGEHTQPAAPARHHTGRELTLAWAPYLLLVVFVLLWGYKPAADPVEHGQHHCSTGRACTTRSSACRRWSASPRPTPRVYTFNWLSASGTACLFAALLSALLVGMKPRQFGKVLRHTVKQLALAELTLAAVLALAFLMNYSGATATLGLAFAATGALFPFFSALLGWLGVFLTGSDTSANALFGNLQVVTAEQAGT